MALSPWPGEWGLDAGALLLAVALDLAFREPPAALHPVVWTGKLIGSLRSLVSRDARALTASQIAMAAIESAAENTTDSYVGPWLAFALFGLPGAVAYRALNTLDSMIGYRGRYEHLGKASARLDDLAVCAGAPRRRPGEARPLPHRRRLPGPDLVRRGGRRPAGVRRRRARGADGARSDFRSWTPLGIAWGQPRTTRWNSPGPCTAA